MLTDDTGRTLFERSRPGQRGTGSLEWDVPRPGLDALIPANLRRKSAPRLPELSEGEVVRHFVNLSTKNHHIDKGFYPLGSCTMKYNPKVNESLSRLSGFATLHPLQPSETIQGALELIWRLERDLAEISGMDAVSLQPAAGAHGELTALLVVRAYHLSRGETRKKILIPDSAHGTNPASAAIAGFECVTVKSAADGRVDVEDLKSKLSSDVAAFMITNPNTVGLFETRVEEICAACHAVGAQVYMDGANLNALVGIARPGDLGFDVMHFNLHKTFSTPHGGGGPGCGPVGVKSHLAPFLPSPRVEKRGDVYTQEKPSTSIGPVHGAFGNFLVMVRAYAYILAMGSEGMAEIGRTAVLNANYLYAKIRHTLACKYDGPYMHEFVLDGSALKKTGLHTSDFAKRLMDFGVYAPTIYFPLIVPEAMMIEPTETESRETLDRFAEIFLEVWREANETPDVVHSAPHNLPLKRVDDVRAAKELVLTHPF
ncbi:MAG: aminomethyl-transferring glycine dehydrogenase subunit GcvPB [Fibrobacterota bacterium]|nr:aminomethyl-transferring glycine dehydrogenase subunit GcvPB [Fibrobacterota bacterium]QQS04403.1 MAG: aminomethyl-transferring glycine dehydrogenase subunit GcvPB [Fibrobacterota bacterium]